MSKKSPDPALVVFLFIVWLLATIATGGFFVIGIFCAKIPRIYEVWSLLAFLFSLANFALATEATE